MKRILLSGCFAALSLAVYGQQIDSTLKADTTGQPLFSSTLAPIEVRALRLNEKAPFSVTNISQQQISSQNLGASFPYLLSQLPSVVTSSDDGIGVGYASLRIRGSDMARTNVTFNGIPVNDPESQGAFFVNFGDLASSAASVQIQRGVGASTNGAGAFGASMNIYTLQQDQQGSARISNSYGSFNTWKHTLQAGTGKLAGGFQFDLRLSRISSDGYIQRSGTLLKSLQFLAGWTSKDEQTNIKFNLLSGNEKTGQAWNGIGTYYTDQDDPASIDYKKQLEAAAPAGRRSNTLGQINDSTYYEDQTDNYQQDYYQFFVNHKFNSGWSANLSFFMTRGRGYYNEYKDGESLADYGLEPVEVGGTTIESTNLTRQLWLDNYYYGTVFSANYSKGNTDFNAGGAYTSYDARHYGFVKWAEWGVPLDYRWYHLSAYKKDANLYAKLQQQITRGLYGYLDLQLRNVHYDINGFRKNPALDSIDNNYTFFNPKGGLSYLITHAHEGLSKIYASLALAHKEPNRDDFEAAGQQAPRPEQLTDVELGYQYSRPGFEAGINGYYMYYKDQLILTGKINDVGAYVRTNVDRSYQAGIELTTAIQPWKRLLIHANATLSRNKIKAITQFSDDYDNGGQLEQSFSNTDIAFSPNTIAGASLRLEPFTDPAGSRHFYLEVLEKYVSRQYLDNAQDELKSINPYALTDVRVAYQFTNRRFKDISLILLVRNLLNQAYENNGYTYSYLYGGSLTTENYYYPQAGTNWNFGVNISL
ncbi:TonB-dependent receptor [Niabella terrae]